MSLVTCEHSKAVFIQLCNLLSDTKFWIYIDYYRFVNTVYTWGHYHLTKVQ